MLRGVATLLVVLPLLMPPGVCTCRFAHAGEPAAPADGHTGGATDPADHEEGPGECSSCCTRSKLPHGKPDGRPDSRQDRSPQPTAPHAPGCPAAKATELSKFTEPVLSAGTLIGPSTALPATDSTPGPVRVAQPTDTPPGPSRPIYVHFCTLLI
jgi:hypothetical protein